MWINHPPTSTDVYEMIFKQRLFDVLLGLLFATVLTDQASALYDPGVGRFCSRDPIGYEGSEWNMYEYVCGMILDRVDPSGLQAVDCANKRDECYKGAESDFDWCQRRGRTICFAACVYLLRNPKRDVVKDACLKAIPVIGCEELCYSAYENACNGDFQNTMSCCDLAFAYCKANGDWPGYFWRLRNGCNF
jgi:RHS repeat-associated protein